MLLILFAYALVLWVDSTFVVDSKIMENVEECGVFEVVSEVTVFVVSRHQGTEPVISDDERRLDLELTKQLQTSFSNGGDLGDSSSSVHLSQNQKNSKKKIEKKLVFTSWYK